MTNGEAEIMKWTIKVSLFRNPLIRNQMLLAIGIPFGLLIVFLALIEAYQGIVLVGLLFVVSILLILLLWGGKYHAGFELTSDGIRNFTVKEQAKRNRILNWVTILAGLISGKPTVAGAGLLAQSRLEVKLRWSRIRKVRFYPGSKTILLKGGFAESVALFCTTENYQTVENFVRSMLPEKTIIHPKEGVPLMKWKVNNTN